MLTTKIMMVRNKIPIVGIFPTMGITLMPYLLSHTTKWKSISFAKWHFYVKNIINYQCVSMPVPHGHLSGKKWYGDCVLSGGKDALIVDGANVLTIETGAGAYDGIPPDGEVISASGTVRSERRRPEIAALTLIFG